MKTNELLHKFLEERDHTGRLIVKSLETGNVYFVEPIENERPKSFGDIDPATKKVTGQYGKKYRGAVKNEDSQITKENGFEDITTTKGSYMTEINRREQEYLNKINN
jgi:hypothetical protein